MKFIIVVRRRLLMILICSLVVACEQVSERGPSGINAYNTSVYNCILSSGVPLLLTQRRCTELGGRIESSRTYHPLDKLPDEFVCGVALTTDFEWGDLSGRVGKEVERRQFSLADCRRIVGYQGQ